MDMLIEGVTYEINWRLFPKGASFFVPCLDHASAYTVVSETTTRLKFTTVYKGVIENGITGIRIWRI